MRALEREARAYAKRQAKLDAAARGEREQQPTGEEPVEDELGAEPEDLGDDERVDEARDD